VRLPEGVLGRSYPEPVAQGDAVEVDLTADTSPLDLCEMSENKAELCPIIKLHVEKAFRRFSLDADGGDLEDMPKCFCS